MLRAMEIQPGTLVDYAARVSDIAGRVVSVDEDSAMVTEYFLDEHDTRPAQTRRIPLHMIRPHRCGQLCECD